MRIYIDQLNIVSFFKDKKHPLFEDSLRMLKSQSDLYFNFPKATLLSDEALQVIITQMTSGSKDTPKPKFKEEPFPPRPLKSNVHGDLVHREDLTAAYLITDEKITSVQQQGCLLVGGEGQEVETISQLFFDDFQFTKSFTPKKDMPSWEALAHTVRPCTDIIIVDRYLFASEELLDYNLHAFLAVLGGNLPNRKFNLVIFTSKTQIIDINGKKSQFTPDWGKLRNAIRSYLKKKYGSTPNVTIVTLNRVEEHDRTIFTNYNNSYSGDSLTYYDSNWNHISKGRNYAVHSHGLRENLTKGFYFIDDMQDILNGLTSVRDKECIVGDKKCNFLKFPD